MYTERVQRLWEEIADEEFEYLVATMPERIAAVIAANGGHTRY